MPKTKKEKLTKKISSVETEKQIYFEGVGRRKTAIARVRIFPQKSVAHEIVINEKKLEDYFPLKIWQDTILAPLVLTDTLNKFKILVKVKGGGITAQTEAIRHGLARALVLFNNEWRTKLKRAGYLKRDPRMRERKKFGLKRARRAPQWQKR